MSFELLRDAVIAALDSSTFEKSKVAMAFESATEDIAVVTFTRGEIERNTIGVANQAFTDDQWFQIKDVIEQEIGDLTQIEHIVATALENDKGDDDDDYDEIKGTMFDDSDAPEYI